MAKVPIAVIWNATQKRITVQPELAKVYWGDEHRDSAVWTLLSGDEEIEIEDIRFRPGPPKGPFKSLGPAGPKQWEGSDLARKDQIFKYEVKLSNGVIEDPALIEEERPT